MIDYSLLQKGMKISVHANRGYYDFFNVFFVEQDDESIVINGFLSLENVRIPKKDIVEIQVGRKNI